MIRKILASLRRSRTRNAEQEWRPLPYEQQVALPEPARPTYAAALTLDGARLLALEPPSRSAMPSQRRSGSAWARMARAQMRRAMVEPDGWV